MKLTICFDDELFAIKIENIIKHLYPNSVLETGICEVRQLINCINRYGLDCNIILLDMNYRDIEQDGIHLGMMINNLMPSCKIMYLVDDYDAIPKVYDVTHYCLIRKIDAPVCMEHFITRLLKDYSQTMQRDYLEIISKRRKIYISQINIEYIERRQRVLEIHTLDKVYKIYSSIKAINNSLNSLFERCHGSFIVNMKYINCADGNDISMRSGVIIPVGKTYKKEFDIKYKIYQKNYL